MILLDTHVLIWVSEGSKRIPKAAKHAIKTGRRTGALAISSLTLYELVQLEVRGRLRIKPSIDAYLEEIESLFVVRPVDAEIAMAAARLPHTYPGDPVDRLIGATAIRGKHAAGHRGRAHPAVRLSSDDLVISEGT
jgi:PIN domain nuclease of toxin-antitoxin system